MEVRSHGNTVQMRIMGTIYFIRFPNPQAAQAFVRAAQESDRVVTTAPRAWPSSMAR